jgi:hypothetical protein
MLQHPFCYDREDRNVVAWARHCERSEAIQCGHEVLDCFVVLLLAMTRPQLIVIRHPEVRAERASKDAALALGLSPFEARRYAPSTSG